MARGTQTRFTFSEGTETRPVWTPDGKEIFYHHVAKDSILARPADGTGAPRVIVKGRAPEITGDGRRLIYHFQAGAGAQEDLWYAPLDGSSVPQPFLATPARERRPRISPDGRYLAYQSNESGASEIYLTRFPSGEGKWQVSIGGGSHPQWNKSGTRLYYRQDGCAVVEVSVETAPALVLGKPERLIECDELKLARRPWLTYSVSGDGERFVLVQTSNPNTEKIDIGITVVENWFGEFKNRGGR